ncbi:peptidoglycan DD-metalloendopeptidase family protein [Polaribacter porphyrae]|uniref:Peptidase M23 n=1 Tax=Polaribacter porphyrae TaxID=1137780 RepID=A0A2S7WRG2_9FLAO|nr:peptidoglycan DD-metalloendopeptidase family protein [Polaribacter porphyrae]PQJ80188.1 peptidase M23 [Polaribacter porphyrae]
MKKALILLVLILSFSSCKKENKNQSLPQKIEEKKPEIRFGYNLDNYKIIQDTIKSGESFGVILDRHHVMYPKINQIASIVKDTFDVRRVRAGKPYTILASKDSIEKAQVFIYKHDKINATILDFKDSIIKAKRYKKPIKIIEKKVEGIVNTNFTFSMDSLGLKPNLTFNVADIYAWTLDFYKLQKGDSFKLIYEEKYIDDSTFAGYGKIKSAVFKHKGKNLYAFRYVADSILNIPEYYDEEANMLRSQFLKSPIKFQYRISSRYNLRRRIAFYGNRIRPHKGTDFAARVGTPIIATASGTVTESKRRGGNGNYVKIKHNNTYSTQYLHMKRRKVKRGDYVKQGDIIGTVGMTGNTSGPHVCYRFWKYGKQVDPLREKLPAAKPMKKSVKPKYFEFIKTLKYQLDYNQIPIEEPEEISETIAKN